MRKPISELVRIGHGWGCKVYPSGAFVLYREKVAHEDPIRRAFDETVQVSLREAIGRNMRSMQGDDSPTTSGAGSGDDRDAGVLLPGGGGEAVDLVPLDLTIPTNSVNHDSSTKKQRLRRGSRGITALGRRYTMEVATQLQRQFGKSALVFLTLTVPAFAPDALSDIWRGWSTVVDRFLVSLRRELARKSLPTTVVGCIEVQPKRLLHRGEAGLHLHLVYVGRNSRGGWRISIPRLRQFWASALSAVRSTRVEQLMGAVDAKAVYKSAAGYLGKYLSKGKASSKELREKYPEWIPTAWYICTRLARSWVRKGTHSGPAWADYIWALVSSGDSSVSGLYAITLPHPLVGEIAVAFTGVFEDIHPPPPLREMTAA